MVDVSALSWIQSRAAVNEILTYIQVTRTIVVDKEANLSHNLDLSISKKSPGAFSVTTGGGVAMQWQKGR